MHKLARSLLAVPALLWLVVGAAVPLVAAPSPAAAQAVCSYIQTGAILSAAQWNACFSSKRDLSTPIILAPPVITAGHSACWSTTTLLADCGAVPASVVAGTGVSVSAAGSAYTVNNAGVLTLSGGTTGLTPSAPTAGAVTLGGTLAVANGGTGATTATGSGAVVLATSPTLVTPALGTPSAAVLTNATGLPLATGVTGTLAVANGGTGVTASTGTGAGVHASSPTLVTPALGAATATSVTVAGTSFLNGTTLGMPTNGSVQWNADTILQRDAANALALRNGVNAQTFNIYNTYTDAANYEQGFAAWTGNTFHVGTFAAGTGTQRPVSFDAGGSGRWQLTTAGHWFAQADNQYDIGASAANRPRNVYVAGNYTGGGSISAINLNSGIGGAGTIGLGNRVFLIDDAANALALRNGVNGQTLNVYNTFTDAANYERGGLAWGSNALRVFTGQLGTGSARDIVFNTNNADRWSVAGSTGNLLASTDNTYDIGASGANRPRSIYAGTNITAGNFVLASNLQAASTGSISWGSRGLLTSPAAGTVQHGDADAAAPVAQTITAQSVVAGTANTAAPNFTFDMPKGTGTGTGGSFVVRVAPAGTTGSAQNAMATALTIASNGVATFTNGVTGVGYTNGAANAYAWSARSQISSPANGNILLSNNGGTDFGLLAFGQATNAFPALKKSGVELQVRVADDTAYGNLRANIIVAQSYLYSTPVTVAALASCTGLAGARQFVTDATVVASGNFAVAVTGGGANTVPVYCDGTSWKIG